MKGGALSRGSFAPDAAAVAVNNSQHRGRSDTAAGEFFGRMEALEGAKQLGGELHIKADAVVPHLENLAGRGVLGAEFNFGPRLPAGEIPGVTQQVLQQDLP